MDLDRIHDGVRVTKLAGPGVPGYEYDPPLYHLDLRAGRFAELEADPVGFLLNLGLGPDQGVAPEGEMTVRVTSPDWGWDGARWVRRLASDDVVLPPDGGTDGGAGVPHSCCYISGPAEMTCHVHHQDPHTDTVFVDE